MRSTVMRMVTAIASMFGFVSVATRAPATPAKPWSKTYNMVSPPARVSKDRLGARTSPDYDRRHDRFKAGCRANVRRLMARKRGRLHRERLNDKGAGRYCSLEEFDFRKAA